MSLALALGSKYLALDGQSLALEVVLDVDRELSNVRPLYYTIIVKSP